MAEYIKREEVYQYLDNEVEWNVNQDRLYTLEVISDFPAADVAEVRHGRWIFDPGKIPYCSECKEYSDDGDKGATFCPWCGARMGKEDEHEAD